MNSLDSNQTLQAVFVGDGSLLIECAETWRRRGHAVTAVVTAEPRIASWASKLEIPVVGPGKDLGQRLDGRRFDFLFSIANLRVIRQDALDLPRVASINFHDGPLPRYAGLYTPAWALIEGASKYGISFHEMSGGVDEGDVIVTRDFEVDERETSVTLNTKNFAAAIEAFGELCERAEGGRLEGQPQPQEDRRYYGRFQRPAAVCCIDPHVAAQHSERLVRALDFGHYENPFGIAKVMHRGRGVIVERARALSKSGGPPGTLLRVDDALVLACAEGSLKLEGFRTLDGDALDVGAVLELLELEAGACIDAFSDEQRRCLSDATERLARAEGRLSPRLREPKPLDLHLLRDDRTATEARHRIVRDLTVCRAEDPVAAAQAAVAVALGRIASAESFDVALSDPDGLGDLSFAKELFCRQIPWRLSLDFSTSVKQAFDTVLEMRAQAVSTGPLLRDAVWRMARGSDGKASRLPVVITRQGGPGAEQAAVVFEVSSDGRRLELGFDPELLDAEDADLLVTAVEHVLRAVERTPDLPLSKLSLLSERDRKVLLEDWNATDVDYERSSTVVDQLARQAATTPDKIALISGSTQISYEALDRRTNQLAHHLIQLGIGRQDRVLIRLSRGADLIIAAIGIWKAGAAYVPLDPDYPAERLEFMTADSGAKVVVTDRPDTVGSDGPRAVAIDETTLDALPVSPPERRPEPSDLAYVIYTSGSTGRPKGVMVEHRNVVNFFVGMDGRVPREAPGVWLAVTSLSFDISVLELFWTLSRGFTVVVHTSTGRGKVDSRASARGGVDLGLFFWGNDEAPGRQKYQLLLDAARFADRNGFSFISTPERHFHAFGGPFPNPSVAGAAIAAITERVQIRAGSCVLPLHHPVRVAEEWAFVDNLSDGRVALAFAAGWQPNDFVIRPEAFDGAKAKLASDIEVVRRLWRGESVPFDNPKGESVPTRTLPRPVQPELPVWITTAGNIKSYEAAGRAGANVLTHLLGQSLSEVSDKVRAYRQARAEAGLDPATGRVTLMLHTFVGGSDESVRETVRGPMKAYLASSVSLIKGFAWAFPAFKRPEGVKATDDLPLDDLSEEEMDALLDHAFERYFETSGLFGTEARCVETLGRIADAGLDEVACLIDYGVPTEQVLASLPALANVRARAERKAASSAEDDLAALVSKHGVTHLQCTPSMAKMLLSDEATRAALTKLECLMVGGEALPPPLAREIRAALPDTLVMNMYGPTEATVWSTTHTVQKDSDVVPIGTPIANTRVYVVDRFLQPTPINVPGELLIGGEGVTRGYHERAELTAERFIADPLSDRQGARAYRTGDLVKWRRDGTLEFLGRLDEQVKVLGYRVELGEVERALLAQPRVHSAAVVARDDGEGYRSLVGYVTLTGGSDVQPGALRDALRKHLPEYMVPARLVVLDALPLTANGKTDKKALPAPSAATTKRSASSMPSAPPASDVERLIAEEWQSVLGLEAIGRTDNFFDIGGHSLTMVQVHRALAGKLDRPISLTDLYRFPTVGALAAHVGGNGAPAGSEAVSRANSRGARRRAALGRRNRGTLQ